MEKTSVSKKRGAKSFQMRIESADLLKTESRALKVVPISAIGLITLEGVFQFLDTVELNRNLIDDNKT